MSFNISADVDVQVEVEPQVEIELQPQADIELEADANIEDSHEIEVNIEVESPEVELEVQAPEIVIESSNGANVELNANVDISNENDEAGGQVVVEVSKSSSCNWFCCTKCCVTSIYTLGKCLSWCYVIILWLVALILLTIGIVASVYIGSGKFLPDPLKKTLGNATMSVISPFFIVLPVIILVMAIL